jgi:hypothetical protein
MCVCVCIVNDMNYDWPGTELGLMASSEGFCWETSWEGRDFPNPDSDEKIKRRKNTIQTVPRPKL